MPDRVVAADEAFSIVVVDVIALPEVPIAVACARAEDFTEGLPAVAAPAKSNLDTTYERIDEEVLAEGRLAQAICSTTNERQSSVEAFLIEADPKTQ